MGVVYKVTSASIEKTKRGYEVFKLQLNNSFWATKLVPLRKLDRTYDKLYQLYTENSNGLEFLVGKHVSISLNKSEYGVEFSSISSCDVLQDFKNLLDRSEGKAFTTRIQMYEFLKQKNYSINPDHSITLKKSYDNIDIKSNGNITICYPNKLEENLLTPDNIAAIYNHFYQGKFIDNGNPDRDSEYLLTPVTIVENRKIYHKSKSITISNDNWDVLRIGDKLSKEQLEYILEKQQQDSKPQNKT